MQGQEVLAKHTKKHAHSPCLLDLSQRHDDRCAFDWNELADDEYVPTSSCRSVGYRYELSDFLSQAGSCKDP
jgi:hypothetical protein